jgi:hypothetical protein
MAKAVASPIQHPKNTESLFDGTSSEFVFRLIAYMTAKTTKTPKARYNADETKENHEYVSIEGRIRNWNHVYDSPSRPVAKERTVATKKNLTLIAYYHKNKTEHCFCMFCADPEKCSVELDASILI